MWPESDSPGNVPPNPDLGTSFPELGPPVSQPKPGKRPGTSGYYWFPTPAPDAVGISWSVVTCRDLGCGPDAGHDADLWPRLIDRLAASWGRDAQALRRRLDQSYTGLPRGRVTRPEKEFLILHGNNSPIPGWQGQVIGAFSLTGRRVRILFDEHETMIPGHPEAVEASLGIRLYGPGG